MAGALLRITILLTLLLLCGCAGPGGADLRRDAGQHEKSADLPADTPDDGLPNIAPLAAEPRTASSEQLFRLGRETYDRHSEATNVITSLTLPSAADDFCWAIWQLSPGIMQAESLSVLLEEAPAQGTWLALADFSAQRWQFTKPLSSTAFLSIVEARHLSPGQHIYVALFSSGGETANVDSLTLAVSGNIRPQVVLSANPQEGEAPFTATLSAVDSFDQDGSIVDFQWDLDGDGLLSEEGAEAAARGTMSVELEVDAAGNISPAVYITDNQGALSAGGAFISAYGWGATEIRPFGSFTAHSQLTQINGFPAISYYHGADDCLHYAWPRSSALLGHWDSEAVDSTPGAGYGTSMRIFAGNPAIAYIRYDATNTANSKLCFAYSNGGSNQKPGEWALTEIETVGNTVPEIELISIDGKPAIAYCNGLESSLKLAVSSSANGAQPVDWSSHEVADAPAGERFFSMAVIDGNPALVFSREGAGGLSYLRSSSSLPTESADWQSIVLDETAVTVRYPDLYELGGRPAISYSESPAGNLWYARSSSADGSDSNDWSLVTVDSASGASLYTSLGEIDGRPAIAYHAGDPQMLRLAESSNSNGTGSGVWSDRSISTEVGSGAYVSLLSINTVPMIAECSNMLNGGGLRFHLLLSAP